MIFHYLPSPKTPLKFRVFTLIEILITIYLRALPTTLMEQNLLHAKTIFDLEQRAKLSYLLITQARALAITHRMRIFLCEAHEKRILP